MQNECYTYFRISGDFDKDVIIKALNITPEKAVNKGEPRKEGSSFRYPTSWCIFCKCDEYDVYVENQMLKTISPFFGKKDILKEIKEKYNAEFTLVVVPTIVAGESAPCLAPTLEIMQFCVETGTEIDIDLYLI